MVLHAMILARHDRRETVGRQRPCLERRFPLQAAETPIGERSRQADQRAQGKQADSQRGKDGEQSPEKTVERSLEGEEQDAGGNDGEAGGDSGKQAGRQHGLTHHVPDIAGRRVEAAWGGLESPVVAPLVGQFPAHGVETVERAVAGVRWLGADDLVRLCGEFLFSQDPTHRMAGRAGKTKARHIARCRRDGQSVPVQQGGEIPFFVERAGGLEDRPQPWTGLVGNGRDRGFLVSVGGEFEHQMLEFVRTLTGLIGVADHRQAGEMHQAGGVERGADVAAGRIAERVEHGAQPRGGDGAGNRHSDGDEGMRDLARFGGHVELDAQSFRKGATARKPARRAGGPAQARRGKQRAEGLPDLDPGERGANAPVNAMSENQRIALRTLGVEALRRGNVILVEHRRQAPGPHRGARLERFLPPGAPCQNRVARHGAKRTGIDRLEAHRLVDGAGQRGVIAARKRRLDRRARLRHRQDDIERVAGGKQVGRREPGDHAHHYRADLVFAERGGIGVAHGDEPGKRRVARAVSGPHARQRAVDCLQHTRGCHHGELARSGAAGRVGEKQRRQRDRPIGEGGIVFDRHAEIVAADPHRHDFQHPVDDVEARHRGAHDLGGMAGRDRSHDRLDLRRRKGRQQRRLHAPVFGAVLHAEDEIGAARHFLHFGTERCFEILLALQDLAHIGVLEHDDGLAKRQDRPVAPEEAGGRSRIFQKRRHRARDQAGAAQALRIEGGHFRNRALRRLRRPHAVMIFRPEHPVSRILPRP
jgi:hypothetical protein